jgi:hydrogenase-4 component B
LAVFVLLLFGFGLKAAMVPFHFWLPWVHPSVPGNAHTLLSAVGVKVGVYGIIRLLTEISPASVGSPSIAGLTVLVLGGLTALVGVEYAIAEHDLKRILAYHTVENVGIILMGIGLSAVATSIGEPLLAAVALAMALFHVINHAFFKGVLLLATAAIEMRTGTVELDRLGGLFRRMGWTAGFFLVGAVSISALPPFSGFASEWLLLKSLIRGTAALGEVESVGGLVVVVTAFLMLAHAVAYTAFCFAKICGLILAGNPRTGNSGTGEEPKEPGRSPSFGMGFAMAVLAGGCLLFGVAPGWVLGRLFEVVAGLGLEAVPLEPAWHQLPKLAESETAAFSPVFPILPWVLVAAALGLFLHFAGRRRRTRRSWNCGAPLEAASMQADSHQLAVPFFRQALFVRRRPLRAASRDDTLRPVVSRLPRWEIRELFTEIYGAAITRVTGISKWTAERVQSGDLRLYLGYLLGALVVIFLLFSLWPEPNVSVAVPR